VGGRERHRPSAFATVGQGRVAGHGRRLGREGRAGPERAAAGRKDGRAARRRKGGWVAGATTRAELVDELAKGVVVVAELLGGVLLGEAVEKDGAQRLVLALGGTGGLLEELLAACVVHNRGSGCESIVAPLGLEVSRWPRASPGEMVAGKTCGSRETKAVKGGRDAQQRRGAAGRKWGRQEAGLGKKLTRTDEEPAEKGRRATTRVRSFARMEIGVEASTGDAPPQGPFEFLSGPPQKPARSAASPGEHSLVRPTPK
jgi:hypothetical protein